VPQGGRAEGKAQEDQVRDQVDGVHRRDASARGRPVPRVHSQGRSAGPDQAAASTADHAVIAGCHLQQMKESFIQ
jgi:hypothetical protein